MPYRQIAAQRWRRADRLVVLRCQTCPLLAGVGTESGAGSRIAPSQQGDDLIKQPASLRKSLGLLAGGYWRIFSLDGDRAPRRADPAQQEIIRADLA